MTDAHHPVTGYPLLPQDDAESVVRVLAGDPPLKTCADCAWQRGGPWGAPFADGEPSTWMSPRCDFRYIELMDGEYERDSVAGHYTNNHRDGAACGSTTRTTERWVERWQRAVVDRDPADRDQHDRWWTDNYPRFGYRRPDHAACEHWRARALPPPTIREAWRELGEAAPSGL